MSGERLDADELAALEEQRVFLLDSIADLDREHDAGDLDDDDYRALRDDYTARAAATMAEITSRTAADETTAGPKRSRWPLVLGGVAVLLFAVLAGVAVATTSGERKPGESVSGSGAIRQTASAQAQQCIAMTQEALAADAGEMATQGVAALKCYGEVLKSAPDNPVAHAYRGWTAALMARRLDGAIPEATMQSLVTQASADVAAARKADPTYADAIVFSAITKMWQGDIAGARTDLAAFDALGLPAGNQMSQLVGTMLRPQLAASDTAATTSTTQPG